jgi:hypothetical protein
MELYPHPLNPDTRNPLLLHECDRIYVLGELDELLFFLSLISEHSLSQNERKRLQSGVDFQFIKLIPLGSKSP